MTAMKTSRLIALLFTALLAQSALAHTELTETVPADRSTLAAAPENLQLRFSEPVRLTALTIQKDDVQKQSLGPLPSATTGSFAVALPAMLEAGHYVVTWRAMSEDTHVMSGEFMFAVGAEGSPDAHVDHGAAPAATAAPAAPATPAHDEHGGTH
jgi:methionine-rich copper-binding protein CopC